MCLTVNQSYSDVIVTVSSISNLDQPIARLCHINATVENWQNLRFPTFLNPVFIAQTVGTQQQNAILIHRKTLHSRVQSVGGSNAQSLNQSSSGHLFQSIPVKRIAQTHLAASHIIIESNLIAAGAGNPVSPTVSDVGDVEFVNVC